MLWQDFLEQLDEARVKDLDMLVRKYRGIGPLLTKVEGLVVHTNTGKSPKLRQYYAHWERKIFDALTKMILENLKSFNRALCSNQPLFQIETLLAAPDVIFHPSASEVYKLGLQCVKDCVERYCSYIC